MIQQLDDEDLINQEDSTKLIDKGILPKSSLNNYKCNIYVKGTKKLLQINESYLKFNFSQKYTQLIKRLNCIVDILPLLDNILNEEKELICQNCQIYYNDIMEMAKENEKAYSKFVKNGFYYKSVLDQIENKYETMKNKTDKEVLRKLSWETEKIIGKFVSSFFSEFKNFVNRFKKIEKDVNNIYLKIV